jgi:hypothetical protein
MAQAGTPSIVDNPRTSQNPHIMTFTKDLEIGPDRDEDYTFWGGAVIMDVNKDGHMFVVDTDSNRIIQFDAAGKYVREIGGEGDGPGEYRKLNSFKILQDQSAVAFDNLQGGVNIFTYLDKDMNYVRRRRFSEHTRGLQSAVLSPNGEHIGSLYLEFSEDEPGKANIKTGILDRGRRELILLSEVEQNSFDINQAQDPNWWAKFLAQWLKLGSKGMGVMAFDDAGRVYTAVSNKYEITRWSSDLKKEIVVTRDFKPIGQSPEQIAAFAEPLWSEIISALPAEFQQIVTPRVVERAIELAEFPPRKTPIFGIIPMDTGHFLVVHDHDPLSMKTTADIYDENGTYLGPTRLPHLNVDLFGGLFGNPVKMIISNGYAYTIGPDPLGDLFLVRYKYTLEPKK